MAEEVKAEVKAEFKAEFKAEDKAEDKAEGRAEGRAGGVQIPLHKADEDDIDDESDSPISNLLAPFWTLTNAVC